jgi:hypothetical protein
MKAILMGGIFLLLLTGCQKDETNECHSPCIQSYVDSFRQSDEICGTGASVKQYLFQGQTVYVFDKGLCIADGTSDVRNAECTFLGALGGIQGNTRINGAEFNTAVYQRTLWSN